MISHSRDGHHSTRLAWSGPRALAITWTIALLAFVVLVLWTPPSILREHLKRLHFWALEICVLMVVASVVAVARQVSTSALRHHLLRVAPLASLGLLLVVFVAPRTNRIYFDEQIYAGIAQNLADLKLAQGCNDGNVEDGRLRCSSGEYNKQPYAYPHLLSLAYRVFGTGDDRAFALNAFVFVLTICAVYLLALLLFRDSVAALFAGLLMALIPEQILWSATGASEPSASLACATALLCMTLACRFRTTATLSLAGVATAYSVQFRPESILIAATVILLMWASAPDELWTRRFWRVTMLTLSLAAVHLAHLVAVRDEGWGTTDARLSFDYVLPNLLVNGPFYLTDERFPVVITAFAVAALASPGNLAARATLLIYFLSFFAIDLFFYAGSFNYGADVRYSLMTYPPLAVLAGAGAARLARSVETRWRVPGQRVLAAAILFQFLWYVPLVRATGEEAWAARADVRFAKSRVPQLRGNSYVLTHNPSMFHVWGVNAGQMSLIVTNPAYLGFLTAHYSGGVYLHWNFWCSVQDPVQRSFCARALEVAPSTVVEEYWQRGQRYAFYRFASGPRR